ncbi:MAG: hypothetical protein ACM3QV_00025, partial [Caulobacteraceae bacterium]
SGKAPAGSQVNLTLDLRSNMGREFTYTQKTVADETGTYSFVVPYPTEPMKGEGYSYDVTPVSKYTIEYGGTNRTVDVTENAVMNGRTVEVA